MYLRIDKGFYLIDRLRCIKAVPIARREREPKELIEPNVGVLIGVNQSVAESKETGASIE